MADPLPRLSERVAAIMRAEETDLGRPCELVDWAELAHDVIAVVYEPAAFTDKDLGQSREIRTATYVGTRQKFSTIVMTRWERDHAAT